MTNLFNYIDRPSPIHKMTGASKLFCLLLWSLAAMSGFHTPMLAAMTAGAVVLFTILSGAGFTGEAAMMGYTLILAINRPIEMLVTSLNCVGDSVAALTVAKSEGKLDVDTYNA